VGKVILGIAGSHNACVTVYIEDENKYIVLELERLFGHKNLAWATFDPQYWYEDVTNYIKKYLKKHYGITKYDLIRTVGSHYGTHNVAYDFECDLIEHNQGRYLNDGTEIDICHDTGLTSGDSWCAFHHKSHAANTFYQSPFDHALVLSYDGGGDDGWFNGYICDRSKPKDKQMKTVLYSLTDLGNPYMYLGYFIDDIQYVHDFGKACLVYAGKLMGYCAYGKVREEWVQPLREYYKEWHREGLNPVEVGAPDMMQRLGNKTGLQFIFYDMNDDDNGYIGNPCPDNRLKGNDAKDLIATSQKVFEDLFLDEVEPLMDKYKTNVCLTGGCAMNILLNTRIKKLVNQTYNKEVYIAPNSSDCGLATGLVLDYVRPSRHPEPPDLTYAGEEVFDVDTLFWYMASYEYCAVDMEKLIDRMHHSNYIYGLVQGKCEHGPRALGNRSIICSPKPGMKEILNSQVKHREYYRPFAPIVRLEDVSKYFEWEGESRHMNFAAPVKEGYRDLLQSITHEDGTARIQTITREQNAFMYDLLTQMQPMGLVPVLLNTSFNINGKPILNSYKEAFDVYENNNMNGVIILSDYNTEWGQGKPWPGGQGMLFTKNDHDHRFD